MFGGDFFYILMQKAWKSSLDQLNDLLNSFISSGLLHIIRINFSIKSIKLQANDGMTLKTTIRGSYVKN